MRYLFFISMTILAFNLEAQTETKPTSFHLELDLFGTLPTGLGDVEEAKGRFERGGGLNLALRRNLSPGFSLEGGAGVQIFSVRQRNDDLRFPCDAPSLGNDPSYTDATIELSSLTFHIAPIFHLDRDREGLYLKPKLRINYNIGDQVNGSIHECGENEGLTVNVGSASGKQLSVFPGIGFGYQGEGKRGKYSYIEINLSMSAGNVFNKAPSEDEISPLLDFWQESDATMGGITFGWQLGGGKKRRGLPKEQPAPVPGFYSGR